MLSVISLSIVMLSVVMRSARRQGASVIRKILRRFVQPHPDDHLAGD
jgi:hypothetical protein